MPIGKTARKNYRFHLIILIATYLCIPTGVEIGSPEYICGDPDPWPFAAKQLEQHKRLAAYNYTKSIDIL